MGRHTTHWFTVLPCAGALLVSGACSVVSSPAARELTAQVAAEPELLAWAIGATLLERWPGASAMPTSGQVPVVMAGDGLTIEFTTEGGLSSFSATASLRAPSHRSTTQDRVELVMSQPRKLPAPLRALSSSSTFRASLRRATSSDGTPNTRVQLFASGAAAESAVWDRVVRSCDLLDSLGAAHRELESQRPAQAAARAHRALDIAGVVPDAGCSELSAPIWATLALARERLGALAEARAAAASACDAAPGCELYPRLLARLDGRSDDSTTELDSPLAQLGRLATDPRTRLAALVVTERCTQLAARARSEVAIAAANGDSTAEQTRAALASAARAIAKSDRPLALLHSLEAHARTPSDLDLLEQIVALAIECETPVVGLRAIARAWPAVAGRTPRNRLRAFGDRVVAVMPAALAMRVAHSESCDELAAIALANCPNDSARRSALAVVAVERTLRATQIQLDSARLATPPR